MGKEWTTGDDLHSVDDVVLNIIDNVDAVINTAESVPKRRFKRQSACVS